MLNFAKKTTKALANDMFSHVKFESVAHVAAFPVYVGVLVVSSPLWLPPYMMGHAVKYTLERP